MFVSRASERIGSSEGNLRRAEEHVAAADAFPFMQAPERVGQLKAEAGNVLGGYVFAPEAQEWGERLYVVKAGLPAAKEGKAAVDGVDAGKAIGLTPWQRLVHVRLPTMFRIVLPSLSNTYISLFKDTSIASVIAVPELTYAANWINFNTFRIIEAYAVVTPMYLVTGYAILFTLQQLEKRFVIRR